MKAKKIYKGERGRCRLIAKAKSVEFYRIKGFKGIPQNFTELWGVL
jgi:hypothetical protein